MRFRFGSYFFVIGIHSFRCQLAQAQRRKIPDTLIRSSSEYAAFSRKAADFSMIDSILRNYERTNEWMDGQDGWRAKFL